MQFDRLAGGMLISPSYGKALTSDDAPSRQTGSGSEGAEMTVQTYDPIPEYKPHRASDYFCIRWSPDDPGKIFSAQEGVL